MESRVFYIALGDSLTEGVGASTHDQSFTAHFFQAIKQTKECQYMNFGKSGRSSGELLQFLTDSKIRDFLKRATHITITTGGIDMIRAYQNNVNFLEYVRTFQTLKQNLRHILRNTTEMNPTTQVFLMSLYNPGTPDHKLYKVANKLIRRINRLYEETAKQFSVHTIDPLDSFLNKPHLLADEVHPNDLGYKVITDLFLTKYKFVCSPFYPKC
ncbi:GDSL-type esterase/lipase family protein [Bacillus songklensis]|uniref:GDSL-type esterase/lipase family protein n=1 Tax=Bacillus songklensis TaxID=1069116 RepID=A0ABV8B8U7_9BACI